MKQDTPNRREEIRQEVRKTSREEFILKEMKRLGMWPDNEEAPTLQESLIKERSKLSKEIRELSKKNTRYENREAELNKYKKERLKKSKEKQQLNKQKKKEEAEARKKERVEALGKDITYLGKRYSHFLKGTDCDTDLLSKNDLSNIADVASLAKALDVSVYELRFLSFDRKLSKHNHYVTYGIKKKSGGIRIISAPKPRLKKAQKAILENILYKLQPSEYAHGFVKNKSIVTNAQPHVGASVVVNMDLKDFFPTLDYPRIFGFYRKIGFSAQLATILSLICTIPVNETIKVHGEIWYLNNEDKRLLPQGASTSPMLTNLICRRMDYRLAGIAKKLGFTYTRYADDMTFSGGVATRANINKLKWQVRSVIRDEDFELNLKKTHVMVPGHRKEVTGIVVNEKLNISRKKLKAFRALLFQIEKDGLQGKTWGDPNVDTLSSIEGFARYVYMVNPQKGKTILSRVNSISDKYRPKSNPTLLGAITKTIKKVLDGNPDKPWWKVW